MSDDAPQCDDYAENLPELALGILTGRDRAAALAHVDGCAHCAEELEQLSHAADAVLSVAPELEPTVGFEVRLFNRMGVADVPAPRAASRHAPLRWLSSSPRWALAAAASIVALVVGLSVGWSIGSPSGPSRQRPTDPAVASATLTEHGSLVGRVVTYGGSTPWMIVTLADSSAHGNISCEVVTDDGMTHKIGTFAATYGYAAWDAPLRVAPQDVRKAEVVSSNGTVIATATLR
jgi:anti-sigma-K factor RskA